MAADQDSLPRVPPGHWPGPVLGRPSDAAPVRTARRRSGSSWHQSTRANRRHEIGDRVRARSAGHSAASSRWRVVVPLPGRSEPRRRRERPKPTGPTAIISSAAQILVGLAILTVLTITSLIPAVMGWVPLTVLTGSMAPGIPPGSLIVVKSLSEEQAGHLAIGAIVTYLPEADSDVLVTHRIIGMRSAGEGQASYQFQGDANAVPDPDWVEPKQIRGVLRYHVPVLGRMLVLVDPSTKSAWRVVVAVGLALYSIWEGVGIPIERRRLKRRAEEKARRAELAAKQEAQHEQEPASIEPAPADTKVDAPTHQASPAPPWLHLP